MIRAWHFGVLTIAAVIVGAIVSTTLLCMIAGLAICRDGIRSTSFQPQILASGERQGESRSTERAVNATEL